MARRKATQQTSNSADSLSSSILKATRSGGMPAARTHPELIMGSEEINCLLYSYLMDSGFEHAAFVLRAEARLDKSPVAAKAFIKRGLLVELLAKSLLYTEVEAHYVEGSPLGTPSTCKAPFSLLKKHVCASASASKQPQPPPQPPQPRPQNGASETGKRKAAQQGPEDRSGKRARTGDTDLSQVQAPQPKQSVTTKPVAVVNAAPAVNGNSARPALPVLAEPKPVAPKLPQFRMLTGHNGSIFCASWNLAEARTLASGSEDGTIRIWDVQSRGDEVLTSSRVLKEDRPDSTSLSDEHQQSIICLDFNRYGTLIASGGYDSSLRVWKKDGSLGFSSQNHHGPIFNVKFSPSGMFLLSASLDGTAAIFDVRAKKLIREYRYNEGLEGIIFGQAGGCLDVDWYDEDTFVSCWSDKTITVFTRISPIPFRVYHGHTEDVNQVRFCANRKMMASCSDDGTLRLWNSRDFKPAASAWTAASGAEQTVHMSDTVHVMRGHEKSISNLSWIPTRDNKDQNIIATASFDDTARLWDVLTGTCLHIIRGHSQNCFAATFSPDGAYLSTGGGDATLKITSVKTGKPLFEHKFDNERGAVYDLSWRRTPEGETRLAACVGNTVALFDILKLRLPTS